MPRNSSGVYTFPAGANRPVVAGTTVNATAQNALEEDIRAALSDSLSRSGSGGMTTPFRNSDGTLAAPGITFTNETGSGWYRVGANIIAWVIAGAERLRVFATGAKVTGTLEVTGATTLDTTLAVTGALTAASVTSGGAAFIASPGDIQASRNGTPTQGYVQLGNLANRLVGYDGTNYLMPGAPLVNSAAFVVAGRVTGGTGAVASQTGSVTASGARTGAGAYTITVPGLTTSGIVVTSGANAGFTVVSAPGTGSFTCGSTISPATLTDGDFNFVVLKL